MRQRVVRIDCECALEQRHAERAVRHSCIRERRRAQHKVVGVEIIGPFALDALNFGLTQARLDRGNHTRRQFVLQREDVVERSVVTIGPDVAPGLRFDELAGDAHAVRLLRTLPSST